MLKAYDFIEYNTDKNLHDTRIFKEEKSIAEKAVRNIDNSGLEPSECIICSSDQLAPFVEIWGVRYFRCESCYSIFTVAGTGIVEEYRNNKELIDLRLSEKYQKNAVERRGVVWDDMVDWVTFRSFRYLGRNKNLKIIDYGNRYLGLINKWINSSIVEKYELRDSIIDNSRIRSTHIEKADIVLYQNIIQQSTDPVNDLLGLHESLKDDGLLFLSTRIGTGFDILTLQQKVTNVFPYEHVLLPSKEGLEIVLKKAGFKVLEISTPGLLDLQYVLDNRAGIEDNNLFVKYLIETADTNTLSEFQRFLQKSGLSSFAQVIAKKEV